MSDGKRKDRLGRGLAALLGENVAEEPPREGEIRELPVGRIVPNPFQPRRDFPEEELEELARSIRANGLLQPLVVRASGEGGRPRFQLVAGERRLRAVRRLGWERVPAVVREVDDRTLLVLALVENLQREALGPLEEAEGYQVLSEEFDLTQEEIAESVGKDRSTVANMLRLLRLPPSIRRLLERGTLSTGHARALLSVEDPTRAGELARKAASEGWSVREVERRVRKLRERRDPAAAGKAGAGGEGGAEKEDPVLRSLEEELTRALSTRVAVRRRSSGGGVIEIRFHDDEDFERLFARISGREAAEVVG